MVSRSQKTFQKSARRLWKHSTRPSIVALVCCLCTFAVAMPASSKTIASAEFHSFSRPHLDWPLEVSADGSALVSNATFPDFRGTPLIFRLDVSPFVREVLPIDDHSQAPLYCNSDASVIVGTNPFGAFRWTERGGTQSLGDNTSRARDVSSNGRIVVGSRRNPLLGQGEAFRWTEALGFEPLGTHPKYTISQATAVSGDGYYIAGTSGVPVPSERPLPSARAFRWTPAVGLRDLGSPPDRSGYSKAAGISSDGNVIVGEFEGEAFRWTSAEGMVTLGFLPGHRFSSATDVSRDGSRIIGFSTNLAGTYYAFLWTPEMGMRRLQLVLRRDEGISTQGVLLEFADSISQLIWAGTGIPMIKITHVPIEI